MGHLLPACLEQSQHVHMCLRAHSSWLVERAPHSRDRGPQPQFLAVLLLSHRALLAVAADARVHGRQMR